MDQSGYNSDSDRESNTNGNVPQELSIRAPGDQGADSIRVLVRVRPLNQNELSAAGNDSVVYVQNGTNLQVTSADGKRQFQCAYDSVLGPESTQSDVYRVVQNCTECVLDGTIR
jgi:hypothetical protein